MINKHTEHDREWLKRSTDWALFKRVTAKLPYDNLLVYINNIQLQFSLKSSVVFLPDRKFQY